ncbi:uncharacterized protein LOC122014149 [Zingiber officinale]|uniref:uncharacterized protein LOC122014149 n=1 Tax=Zingiber officinale TaxID=94328 RepID=UPI001C4DA92A|nr:uncharacterized protein LOC122014149 [Zingiber officinale]
MIDDDGGLAANQNDCRGSYYNSGHELVVGLDTKKERLGYVKPSLPEAFAARTHCRNNSLPLRNSSLPLFTTVAVAVAGLLSTSRNSPPPAVGILSTSLHRPLPAARLHSASPHSPSSATRLPSISPYHRTTARVSKPFVNHSTLYIKPKAQSQRKCEWSYMACGIFIGKRIHI